MQWLKTGRLLVFRITVNALFPIIPEPLTCVWKWSLNLRKGMSEPFQLNCMAWIYPECTQPLSPKRMNHPRATHQLGNNLATRILSSHANPKVVWRWSEGLQVFIIIYVEFLQTHCPEYSESSCHSSLSSLQFRVRCLKMKTMAVSLSCYSSILHYLVFGAGTMTFSKTRSRGFEAPVLVAGGTKGNGTRERCI